MTCLILWLLAKYAQLKPDLLYTLLKSPLAVVSILLLCYCMVALNAWRWYRLNAQQQISLSYARTLFPTYLGVAYNNVLPGSIGGDFVRLFYVLKRFPTQKSAATLSIFVDRVIGLVSILLIACIVSPFYLNMAQHNSALLSILRACISVLIAVIVVGIVAAILLSENSRITKALQAKLARTTWSNLLSSVLSAIHTYRHAKLVLIESTLVSMMTQLLLLAVMVILMHVMHMPMPPILDILIALAIGQLANLLPLTPGGIGIGEAAFANVILLLNPNATAAYATVFFGMRILSTTSYLPGVLYSIMRLNLSKQQRTTAT